MIPGESIPAEGNVEFNKDHRGVNLTVTNTGDRPVTVGSHFHFALGTALSMALLSTAFGLVIAAGPVARRLERVAPVLSVLGVAFGLWYALGALGVVAYPF